MVRQSVLHFCRSRVHHCVQPDSATAIRRLLPKSLRPTQQSGSTSKIFLIFLRRTFHDHDVETMIGESLPGTYEDLVLRRSVSARLATNEFAGMCDS